MRNRQIKRYCDTCHQMVFSLGHEHGQEVVPPQNTRAAVGCAEVRMLLCGYMRMWPGETIRIEASRLIAPPYYAENIVAAGEPVVAFDEVSSFRLAE